MGSSPAFAMSSAGTPAPLTIDDVTGLTHYLADLQRDGDYAPVTDAVAYAFAYLRSDLTHAGSDMLDAALLAWATHRDAGSPWRLTPDVLAWIDSDNAVAGDLVRRLLTHLTAYLARRSCDPQPTSTPTDDREWSRVRVARRCKWDDQRLSNAERRAARRHDSQSARREPASHTERAAVVMLPGLNRAQRRALEYQHNVSGPLDLDQADDPPPLRRPSTEPCSAHAPPRSRHALAA
jgi:hypothetical protein